MTLKESFRKILHPKVFIFLVEIKNLILPTKAFIEAKTEFEHRIEFYSKFIKEGDLVFDIGANIGNRVKIFIKLGAKVVAVEPQKSCIDFLKAVYGKKATIIQNGVGAIEGKMDFYKAKNSTLSTFSKEWIDKVKNSARFEDNEWTTPVQVPVTTLENLISNFGKPFFLKIDVEGFELEVLKGLKTAVKYISLEYAVPENTQILIESLFYLKGLGRYVVNFSEGESMSLHLKQWLNIDDFLAFVETSDFINTNAGDIYLKLVD